MGIDILSNTRPADAVEAETTLKTCIVSGPSELVGRGLNQFHLLQFFYAWPPKRAMRTAPMPA